MIHFIIHLGQVTQVPNGHSFDLATPDFDAARTNNLGGFLFRLDGLMAYVDPCTTDIKSYDCIPP